MDRAAGFTLAIALAHGLANGLASLPAAAQVASPPAPPGNSSTPWNTSTTPPTPRPPADDSVLSLRVYGDLNKKALPPYQPGPPRPDDPAYAVDVSAVMTRCTDGSLVITALVIGGRVTPLANRCRTEPGGIRTTPAPSCAANSWNCTTTPAN